MKLTLKQVRHIASLARIALTPQEERLYQEQLSSILAYFQQLQEVDTSEVSTDTRVIDVPLPLREDESRAGLAYDDLFANAPEVEDGQFRVPLILPD